MGLFSCIGSLLATTYLWFAFWLIHIVILVLQVVFGLLFCWMYLCFPNTYKRFIGYFHHLSSLVLISFNPFWSVKRIRQSKKQKVRVPPGTIIMANHLCYVDPWVVSSQLFPLHMNFIATSALFKFPILGQVMKISGHIPVSFKKGLDGKYTVDNKDKLIARSENRLNNGGVLMVFPEGSLSKDGELKEFKIGFFKTSIATKAPILPVAMYGNHSLFPPGKQYAMAHPGKVEITFGDLICPRVDETAEELRERVKTAIDALQKTLPLYQKSHPADVVAKEELKIEAQV